MLNYFPVLVKYVCFSVMEDMALAVKNAMSAVCRQWWLLCYSSISDFCDAADKIKICHL